MVMLSVIVMPFTLDYSYYIIFKLVYQSVFTVNASAPISSLLHF